jgi:branched-chain amino acid transport system ATP-binding protein
MSALSIESVSRNFGGVAALSDVSFRVEAGERRVIIGPNGAGKTTLFNMLSGSFPVSSGRIMMFDQNITGLPPNRRARLGLARTYQITNLFPRMTVTENLVLALQALNAGWPSLFRSMRSETALYSRASDILERWHLTEIADRPARAISYGQQRQIDLILAMASEPKVLLLDEPMAGLSAAEVVRVSGMIRALPKTMTILMIEHDMDVALELADRVLVMHQGRKIVEGSAAEVRAHPQVAEIYLGAD